MDGRVFVVVRSRSEAVDAAAIAGAFGGGGHAQAASAIARDGLEDARQRAVAALEAMRSHERLARDVMSARVRTVAPAATVRDAMTLCQRHGQSGVFVVDAGRLVGGVSREDLDKAAGPDWHAPVRGSPSRHVVEAGRTRPCRSCARW